MFGVAGGFEVLLRGVQGFVAEPGLDGAYVNAGAEQKVYQHTSVVPFGQKGKSRTVK